MKQAIVVGLLLFGGLLAWFLASRLSSDALGMAVGLVFGLLAGVPAALLISVSQHRRSDEDDDYGRPAERQPLAYQPPVIVLAAPREEVRSETHYHVHQSGPPAVAHRAAELARYQGPVSQGSRVFRVVGAREEWVE